MAQIEVVAASVLLTIAYAFVLGKTFQLMYGRRFADE